MIIGIFGEQIQETLEPGDDRRLAAQGFFLELSVYYEWKNVVYEWINMIEADRIKIRENIQLGIRMVQILYP
jgi:hypothetical protein